MIPVYWKAGLFFRVEGTGRSPMAGNAASTSEGEKIRSFSGPMVENTLEIDE
jgi:hypothetical protein